MQNFITCTITPSVTKVNQGEREKAALIVVTFFRDSARKPLGQTIEANPKVDILTKTDQSSQAY